LAPAIRTSPDKETLPLIFSFSIRANVVMGTAR
jgi:hypothetical protein